MIFQRTTKAAAGGVRLLLLAAALGLVTLTGEAWAAGGVVAYDLASTSVLRLNLPMSQAVTVTLSDAVGNVAVADPNIVDAKPITNKSLYVIGKKLGTTTVNLFDTDSNPVGLIAVQVGADTGAIASSIKAAVPDSHVRVSSVNGRVRLSGSVPDQQSMDRVLAVVHQFGSDDGSIINTLTFKGGQQVNLQVRILEANRTAGRELGINWWGWGSNGQGGAIGKDILNADAKFGPDKNGVITIPHGAPGSAVGGTGSTFATFVANVLTGGFNIDLIINALESKNLVRTLAEPNLTTLSGQSASFLAGGQVPIRVPDANGNAAIQYKDFGVKLNFTPVVLSDDRIQIRMTPEVSDINGFTAAGDPIFTTRNLDSTVELRDGQSFSVAGLLQSHDKKVQDQLPWLGDVPILGTLFRSSSYQKDETELVVIVTPRLVQPNKPGQVASTPLDKTVPANDPEFFLLGQLEVTPQMIKNFQTGAGVIGPYGYIIDLGDKHK